MNKEQVYKLLKVLDANDCLHSEWDWRDMDEDFNDTEELNEDSEWVVDLINNIINGDD